MATRQYIGARYVPQIMGEWDKNRGYEALSIVTYLNTSYTSKKTVPAGVEISNSEYWVTTGNYNAQVEEYKNEVEEYKNEVDMVLKPYTIFITDSYGFRYNQNGESWVEILARELGYSSENYIKLGVEGGGFAVSDSSKQWLNIIKGYSGDKNKVYKIFIGGGINDSINNGNDLERYMSDFNTYIKENFPNAVVQLAHFGITWTIDSMKERYNRSLTQYRNCEKFGWYYVTNSEYILCSNSFFDVTDPTHPNTLGINTLGNELLNGFKYNVCDVHYHKNTTIALNGFLDTVTETPTSSVSPLIALDNESAKLIGINGGVIANFELSQGVPITINGDVIYRFFEGDFFTCGNSDLTSIGNVTIIFIDTSGAQHPVSADLFLYGKVGNNNVQFGVALHGTYSLTNINRIVVSGSIETNPQL